MTLLMICGCSKGNDVNNEIEPEPVEPNGVWVIVEESINATYADKTKDASYSTKYEYDQNGQVIQKLYYNGSVSKYEYDKNQNKTRELYIDPEDDYWSTTYYEYDERGRLIKEIEKCFGGYFQDTDRYTYEYLEDGTDRISKKNSYLENGINIYYCYEYTDNGFTESCYFGNDLAHSAKHTFNEKGKDTEVIFSEYGRSNFYPDSAVYYEYAEDNETLIKETSYKNWGPKWITEYEYDYSDPNHLINVYKYTYPDSTAESKKETFIDENGNVVKTIDVGIGNDKVETTEYKYDFIDFEQPDNPGPMFKMKIKVKEINIRSKPTTNSEIAGKVAKGDVYEVYETTTAEEYHWYRIGDDQWVADDGTWTERVE